MAELRIVVDEDLNKRLATELNARGRAAIAVSELELHRQLDEPLLESLVRELGEPTDWILVTGDDAMPDEHADALERLQVTVGTIDPRQPSAMTQDAWRRDIIHRWAHAIQRQTPGTVRRYAGSRHASWKPRRRGRRR